jgi:2-polyprenyl-6-methoxyphenol hydroxylase-like FAD-dependent oxidoreductase
MTEIYDVIIIGGGIAGLATGVSILSHNPECRIKIFEKASAYYPLGAALGLFPNGLEAIKGISENVYNKVIKNGVKCKHLVSKDLQGKTLHDKDATDSATSSLFLVWYLLQQFLYEELPHDIVSLNSIYESHAILPNSNVSINIKDRTNLDIRTHVCKVLVAADGIHSQIRHDLFGEILTRYHDKMMFRACIKKEILYPKIENYDDNDANHNSNSNDNGSIHIIDNVKNQSEEQEIGPTLGIYIYVFT